MHPTRAQVKELTSRRLLDALPTLFSKRAMIGLDGFVDQIITVIDKRTGPDSYEPVKTIAHLAKKIGAAAGMSSNYELVVKQMKLGGNGPIMANALASAGVDVTYVGNLGYPTIHPVFDEFSKRAHCITIGNPGATDALEFADGKLMLGKLEPLNDANWDNLLARVGHDKLAQLVGQSQLIGMVNWTMLPHMSRIWAKLLDEVIPNVDRHARKLFVDLADPEKRTHDDIFDALKLLSRFQDQVDVILGLNLKESSEIADVLGLPGKSEPEKFVRETALAIREKLGLYCVCVHPRRSAAAATKDDVALFEGPFVKQPKISTGAGDHFNAGFCLGQVLGFPLIESLCVGVATSGYYVRNGITPNGRQLVDFIGELPDPE